MSLSTTPSHGKRSVTEVRYPQAEQTAKDELRMPTSVVPEPVDTWLQRGKSCLPSVVPHCWTWNRQEKSPTNPEERFVVVMKPKACPDESLDHSLSRQEVRYMSSVLTQPMQEGLVCM